MNALRYVIFCSILFCSANARAGAWMQPEGGGQIITTDEHYATDSSFNADSKRASQTGSYHKDEVDIYAEYGLAEAYTIGVQPSYQWVQTRAGGQTHTDNGLDDTALFVRERVWHDDDNVCSIQELGTVPGPYKKTDAASLGYHQPNLELRGLYGHSGAVEGLDYFTDVEGAYRERFYGPADEAHLDATLGLKPVKGFMLLAQSFNTRGLRNASTSSFVTPSGPNYDLSTVALSGVVDIPYGFSFQLGGTDDISGRNTGGGKAVFIALWRSF